MNKLPEAFSARVSIRNELGLHARPAARIAEIARTAKRKVWITKGHEKVDASSIIDLLTLAAFMGTELTLHIEDPEDRDVMERILALIENGFGE
ncbi:MAG: HPr family phosphocarrier protein [Thermodesulfobacteriota bacterium]